MIVRCVRIFLSIPNIDKKKYDEITVFCLLLYMCLVLYLPSMFTRPHPCFNLQAKDMNHSIASAQSSQTVTQDGSSFESASSLYSLARVDAICDDAGILDDTLPLPPTPAQQQALLAAAAASHPSPTHSVSSSSSGSYCTKNGGAAKKASPTSQPLTTHIVKPMPTTKSKCESVSDEEKSEKRYSSSGYYESPQDDGN